MTAITITAEADQQANQAMLLADRAIVAAITDDIGYGAAGQMLSDVKAKANELERLEKSITRPINDGLKRIRDFFRVPRGRLYEVEQALAEKRVRYREKADREKREAERVAAEAACKERDRLEREAAAIEEEARKKLEADEAKARALDESGKQEKAAASRKAAEAKQLLTANRVAALRHVAETWPTAPIVHRDPPKTQGVHTVTRWHAVVTDKAALIVAVANGQVSSGVLTADVVVLNRMAVALKDQLNIPGVVAECTKSESVRAPTMNGDEGVLSDG